MARLSTGWRRSRTNNTKPESGLRIPIQKLDEAYERLLKSDVKFRFSIDMASLKSE
jgi:D-arabinose 1-dehydrogenase-like Zn-dependent alcohol dehydrogenase